MTDYLLALNAGSSSLKFAIHDSETLHPIYRGGGESRPTGARLEVTSRDGVHCLPLQPGVDFETAALDVLVRWLRDERLCDSLAGAGHRVVTGGAEFIAPTRVDDEVLARMRKLIHLAPLHLPRNLAAMELLRERLPALPQVACFDTAFHASQTLLVRSYALPRELSRQGYLRYGFHGLSYQYIADRRHDLFDPDCADSRIVVAHLGNGASLCALHGGRSIATTMGYSTLDGLVMGTRSGAIDPGLVIQLIKDHDGDVEAVERLLYQESGLLGVSGISHDMRELLASDQPQARFAVDLFVYRIVREFGSLAAALGGVDALVFTGGIGARSSEIRERVVDGLGWLGASLDHKRNVAGNERIEGRESRIAIAAVTTDEEFVVARDTRDLVRTQESTPTA